MPVAEQGASSRIASTGSSGVPFAARRPTTISAVEPGAREILGQSCQTTFRAVERGDVVAGGGELHRLAAGRGAEVEHAARAGREQARGKRGGEVLHPPAAFAEAGQAGDRAAVVEAAMAGASAVPFG